MRSLKVLSVVAALSLSAVSLVNARSIDRNQDRRGQFEPAQQVNAFISRRVLPHETLQVQRELSLRNHQGMRLAVVTVSAYTRNQDVRATLMVDGRAVSRTQTLFASTRRSGPSEATFVIDESVILGQVGSIQMSFSNVVFVEDLGAELVSPRPVTRVVERDLHAFHNFDGQQLNLSDAMGLRPQQSESRTSIVEITAISLVGRSSIEICRPNGRCFGAQQLRERAGKSVLSFELPRAIPVRRLRVQTTGTLFLDSAAVEIEMRRR